MNENQEKLITKALDILEKRATDPDRATGVRIAYNSAIAIITSALLGKEEVLNQFDY
jgi:hypothetical protein